MSKRADQKASEAFPDIPLPNLGKDIVAKRGNLRRAYIHGYEQAEKDTIERACEWLFRHYAVNLVEFRKAMEEE